jgi:hypothetical protein
VRWLLALLLVLHGLIHLLGVPLAWGGPVAGMTRGTLVPLGDLALRVAGVAWLLACLALLVAALGVAVGRDWWRPVALGAAAVSQVLVVLWWPDARAGTLADMLILAAAVWRPGLAAWRSALKAGARV